MNLPFRFYALPSILLALAGCASQGKPPPVISLDGPVQAQPLPEPPKPVEVVAVPEPLALPAQLKPLPEVEYGPGCAGASRREGARFARQRRGAHRADPRGLRQCDSGVALHGRRALSGLCRAGARDRGFLAARRGTDDGRRWRYRALDRGRYVQRQRRSAARQCAGQAHPLGPENQSGHHHQPTHLPAGTDLDGKGVDGLGVLGLSERPDAGLAAPVAGGQRRRAGRYWLVAGEDPFPLRGQR